MTKFKQFWLIVAAVASLGVVGCGGNNDDNSSLVPYGGIYQMSYTRGPGTVLMQVETDGDVNVIIRDSDLGATFSGTGTVDSTGEISGSATDIGGTDEVNFSAQITGTGSGALVTGSITGVFSATFSGAYYASGSQSIFADEYTGSFTGDADGTIELTISTAGVVNITATEGANTYEGTGEVSPLGLLTVNANGVGAAAGTTYSFTGFVDIDGGGDGAWQATDGATTTNGTWTITNAAP